MNHLTKISSLLLLFCVSLLFSCDSGGGNEKTEEEVQLDKLKAAQWTLQTANDGIDRTTEYPGMTLTISGSFSAGGTYNYTSNATSWPSASPWKKDDNWKFQPGSVSNSILRLSDDQTMTYELSNSDKQLSISFVYTGPGFNNGRVASVEGPWTFVFTRP